MKSTSIPEDLALEKSEIEVFEYIVSDACEKNKIILTQNTFSFLQEGRKEVNTNSSPISVDNSSFLLMKSGHCLMTEKLSAPNRTFRSILLFFSDASLLAFGNKYNFQDRICLELVPIHKLNYDEFIKSYVKGLKEIDSVKGAARGKLLQVKFEEIMLYLIEIYGPEFYYSLLGELDIKSITLRRVVENNKLDRLTLPELAFLCNMSISSFKREFGKQYDCSPIKWFQDQRLIHSAFLLKTKNARPSDLYDKTGYESLSNFTQAFKKKFGSTPKQYQMKI